MHIINCFYFRPMFNPSIYIVEDDPIIGADLADRLLEMGYQPVGPFASGEAAYEHLSVLSPDLIIMDIQLEGEWDGIETARRIMAQRPTPIIFLTSNSDDFTFSQAKAILPAAFLSKPFRGRDLRHSIELALSNWSQKEQSERVARSARRASVSASGQAVCKNKRPLGAGDVGRNSVDRGR
jgi:DNA-binding response OmpR family regulator